VPENTLYNPKPPKAPSKPATRPSAAAKPVSNITISPARAAAFEILERVAQTDAHSDDLLHSSRLTDLSQADRNLTTTLVLGVLRWELALDALIQPMLARPDLVLASPVATAIRLGAFQLRYLDRIPAHAALSESVELVRSAGHGHASGMVNAILRKLTRTPPPKVPLYESTAAFAMRLAHPSWLVTRWEKNYGRAAALAICQYDQTPPEAGTLFTASDAASSNVDVADADMPSSPDPSASSLISQEENGALAPRYALPNMDDGSRLVAELAAASHSSPQRIWDCCAAPGGKTLILALRHPTADILASDLSPKRLRNLAERLKVSAPKVRTLVANAEQPPANEAAFDLILCDVPCSGTGTLGRNPELKSRLAPADLSRQAARQRTILTSALTSLAPGGRLLYSTCSLEPEENEQVIAAVLASAPAGISALPLDPILAALNIPATSLLREGHLRTLPGAGFHGDGFFAALFVKS
jgi:16S rRNA (cytosine967-C5)-methyltransferase